MCMLLFYKNALPSESGRRRCAIGHAFRTRPGANCTRTGKRAQTYHADDVAFSQSHVPRVVFCLVHVSVAAGLRYEGGGGAHGAVNHVIT